MVLEVIGPDGRALPCRSLWMMNHLSLSDIYVGIELRGQLKMLVQMNTNWLWIDFEAKWKEFRKYVEVPPNWGQNILTCGGFKGYLHIVHCYHHPKHPTIATSGKKIQALFKSIQSNRSHVLTSNSSILSSSSVYAVEDLQASESFFSFKNPTQNSCGMSSYCAVQVNNVNFPQPRLTHAPTYADYRRFSAKFRRFFANVRYSWIRKKRMN